jgi:asparagine synthase (glutamine-hydrolysing)
MYLLKEKAGSFFNTKNKYIMCGITGIYHLDNSEIELSALERFNNSLSNRGPDGSGYEFFDNNTLGLAHRRLSILDLSESGKQPMSYADQRYWITFNGEIFNFLEVRTELQSKGYQFHSDSDTEVIMAAYIEWGRKCLDKFNGMWAFAIWDKIENELFLSRDRFGIKPLYYIYLPGKIFAFASETRAFKYLDGFQREFDEVLLEHNMEDSYALEGLGYTPFKHILQLLPGHTMTVKRGDHPKQKRWWNIQDHIDINIPETYEAQVEKFYELFRDACRIRLRSDVPIATALSGGLDSTAVYSTVFDILQKESLGRINADSQRAFTAIFPGLPQDEKEYAKKAVAFTGGNITFIEPDVAGLADKIARETQYADFIGPSPITSIASVYEGMRKNGIVVSMDGHGVDEMLYGYRDMIYGLYNNALWNKREHDVKTYAHVLSDLYHSDQRNDMLTRIENDLQVKNKREKNIGYRIRRLVKGEIKFHEYHALSLSSLSDKPYDFSDMPIEKRMLYVEFFQHTLPALLRNFDRAGMMNSIEIRMPFMDWRLVSYVFSLPLMAKIGGGYTKKIVRDAMKDKMDESLRRRTYKVGISSPIEHWFNYYLKDWTLDMLSGTVEKTEIENAYKRGNVEGQLVKKAWQQINLKLIQ